MRERRFGWLPVVLAAASAPAMFGRGGLPPDPAGCYDVEVGLWRAVTDQAVTRPRLPPDRARDSTTWLLPPRVELSHRPVLHPSAQGWLDASAPVGALPTGHRYQGWRPAEDGGIVLRFSSGSAGVGGRLDASGSGFAGPVRTFVVDPGAQAYEREVTLSRVDCASPPPVSSDALRALPRTVELAGGRDLSLGAPAPDGLTAVPRPYGAVGVVARSVGLFAGSDSIAYRVGRNDGRVGVIQLIFPAPADPDALIQRITRAYGPPDPATSVPGGWWHSRITELSVITYPEGGYRLLMQDPRSW